MPRGPELAVVGTDLLIVEIATEVIADVLKDALLERRALPFDGRERAGLHSAGSVSPPHLHAIDDVLLEGSCAPQLI